MDNFQPRLSYDPQASWQIRFSLKEDQLTREDIEDKYLELKMAYGAFRTGPTTLLCYPYQSYKYG